MTHLTAPEPQRRHNRTLDIVRHKRRSSNSCKMMPLSVADRVQPIKKRRDKRKFLSSDTTGSDPTKVRANRKPARAQIKCP
jgi:hypothetical protein